MEKPCLDDIIKRLVKVRPWNQVRLTEAGIRKLCMTSKQISLQQPNLLELKAPIKICGDIHGHYADLLRLFELGGFPPKTNYLFLRNHIGYGKQSLATICLLLAYKIKYPDNFFLLRGNHKCAPINRVYGFSDECKWRFNATLWKIFINCFNCLPIAARFDDKILSIHKGLSSDLSNLDQTRNIPTRLLCPTRACSVICSGQTRTAI
ncbi:hypothetical protein CRG98_020823 [Punica granatum]|uniref:protein-serine/threonine phosphatase n=1 Tax=Punica granatum TaxID=22663 RepID=A0A2I0JSI3_PUNGR|nr:hypothetical protein CRG98_020823 [Punica granatum]